MIKSKFGEIILDEADLCDLIMQGRNITDMKNVTVSNEVDLKQIISIVEDPASLISWTFPYNSDISVPDWDSVNQRNWHMPESYKNIDIAEYVLSLCKTQDQLQRVGAELLAYQEKNLFDLLKYLKYLVDTMKEHKIIWGVGRGSSVASYVLFLLEVHKIDSLYYDLDYTEFLR